MGMEGVGGQMASVVTRQEMRLKAILEGRKKTKESKQK